jgi:alpha-galactosidase
MKMRLFLMLCLWMTMGAAEAVAAPPETLHNASLTVAVRSSDGAYQISSPSLAQPVLVSRLAASVDHQWVLSTAYPRHQAVESTFSGALGSGRTLTITYSGLAGKPDLICHLRLYNDQPYGEVALEVRNTTSGAISVQSLRVVDAIGQPRIDLGGPEQADRVLAESYSEDPTIHIGGLTDAPHGVYAGVQNQLLYNLQSKQGLLLAALTAERFLTVTHLAVQSGASAARISSFTLDSTGTTEPVLERDQIPASQQIQLSLSVAPGKSLESERVMFAVGQDYLRQLQTYGDAVRRLHHARIARIAPMGWWSWTAFYGGINQGDVATNALWQARHLKDLGYTFFQIDEGYQYARGEYVTPNATQFPDGIWVAGHKVAGLGLTFGLWTAPFEVSERSWVYQHHKEWLVHDARGNPISIGHVHRNSDVLYALDTTHPGAQDYLRRTYRKLTREWGARYFKLDFMDSSAIEGYHYRPNTTGLEAERIGLQIIRQTVGDSVLIDKDGSALLTPVGLVDEGRIAPDTGHSFSASKDAVPNIAARFYINRNFYISDPDAFSVSRQVEPQQSWHNTPKSLSLDEARVQIVLAAVAGGMYEIGDDLPTLGADASRMALVQNQELIDWNRLGRAALPLDLLTFDAADEDPTIFFLQEDSHQAMLAVFNWTENSRARHIPLASLPLASGHTFHAYDVLQQDAPVELAGDALALGDQPPHSVRVIKLVDDAVPAAAPAAELHAPATAAAGSVIAFSAQASPNSVPALACRWDFGDGTQETGFHVTHTYTRAGNYTVQASLPGVDGMAASLTQSIQITGYAPTQFDLPRNRRLKETAH